MESNLDTQKTLIQIAIDGVAAAGKGTAAKMLSEKIGVQTLDTGALYRGITVYLTDNNIDLENIPSVISAIETLDLKVGRNESSATFIIVNGNDITERIRDIEISRSVPTVAKLQVVRNKVKSIQNAMIATQDLIMEGRDIGSVMMPNARFKFFVTADLEVRAARRYLQEIINDPTVTLEGIKEDVMKRDHADMTREESPLIKTEDAILIDSSYLTPDQVVDLMIRYVKG